jgi:hypothetical protein
LRRLPQALSIHGEKGDKRENEQNKGGYAGASFFASVSCRLFIVYDLAHD